jgi:hypothetical protein
VEILVGVDPDGDLGAVPQCGLCHGGGAILWDATDGWRTGRAGRTALRRVCSNRLLSGHAFPVGAARGGCGARPTDRATGTRGQ